VPESKSPIHIWKNNQMYGFVKLRKRLQRTKGLPNGEIGELDS